LGRLHAHQRFHLDAEGLFDPERHLAGKSALPLRKLESGRDTFSTRAPAVTDRPRGSIISVRMNDPGWGGLSIRVAVS
jgi:hypothetical protein